MPKKKATRKRRTKNRTTTKKKLAGFTKTKGKYALVFKKGKKLMVGKSRFSSKKTLLANARKYLRK